MKTFADFDVWNEVPHLEGDILMFNDNKTRGYSYWVVSEGNYNTYKYKVQCIGTKRKTTNLPCGLIFQTILIK